MASVEMICISLYDAYQPMMRISQTQDQDGVSHVASVAGLIWSRTRLRMRCRESGHSGRNWAEKRMC